MQASESSGHGRDHPWRAAAIWKGQTCGHARRVPHEQGRDRVPGRVEGYQQSAQQDSHQQGTNERHGFPEGQGGVQGRVGF